MKKLLIAALLMLFCTAAMAGGERQSVLNAVPDPTRSQTFLLWEEGNMPAVTVLSPGRSYNDPAGFRPNIVTYPVPEGVEVKGAVLVCAGGAFQFRNNQYEGTPVAQELAARGYQAFVVNYRLRPYTQEEGALDLASSESMLMCTASIRRTLP